jgi:hypothetical protein
VDVRHPDSPYGPFPANRYSTTWAFTALAKHTRCCGTFTIIRGLNLAKAAIAAR